ncbi:helix-turn-helix domain-containing protein [Streptomyces sp. NPDC059743]|uniref:helix-turn-helix domain-containing protein n=1 Tax=Streptomyces sp. NPDC059743 TaxID=3346928 RepID=UPI0036544FC0
MGNLGELSPYEARDAAGFVESMRQLKERSGLTYRQLEERAARSGDVLARSTLADILRRTSLPRPDVLAAFVRACGDGQRVGAWLDARDRIAAGIALPATAPDPEADASAEAGSQPEAQPRTEASTVSRPRRTKGRTVALAASLMVLPLALVAWALLPDDSADPDAPTAPATGSRTPADGWVTIRPARTPDLCLTDGRDRDGAYASAVAVQLPCARATVPRTYLEPVGEGMYRIQWHHPQEGRGCLTVMSTGPVKGMLEPRNDCARATLFLLQPTAADSTGSFLLRPANSSRCTGIADDDTAEGAEATEERCTGAADQRFLIRAG